MLQVKKETVSGAARIRLAGQITESEDFAALVGIPPEKRVEIECHEITRINSIGVRNWMRHFGKMRQDGAKLKFVACASCLLEQARLVNGFLPPSEIESLSLNYVCESCHTPAVHAVRVDELVGNRVPPVACGKCRSPMQLDELVEEITAFLNSR